MYNQTHSSTQERITRRRPRRAMQLLYSLIFVLLFLAMPPLAGLDSLPGATLFAVPSVAYAQTSPPAPVITEPAEGSTTADDTPTIRGTSEPGYRIWVWGELPYFGCDAVTAADGTWECTMNDWVADDLYTLRARATDKAGNISLDSQPVHLTVDTSTLQNPWIGLGDGSAADPIATINGAGRPGNGIRLKDEQGNVLCTTSVDAAGSWSCTTTPMSAGPHIITAVPVDESGEGPVSYPVNIYVFNLPQTPVITEPAEGSSTKQIYLTIRGTGRLNDDITVKDAEGTVLCTEVVDTDSSWSCSTGRISAGLHTIIATSHDSDGNSADSQPVTFLMDILDIPAPVITEPAEGSTTADDTPTIRGTSEPGYHVWVWEELLNFSCDTIAAADGTWECMVKAPVPVDSYDQTGSLVDDSYTIRAYSSDEAGNISLDSQPVHLTVDTSTLQNPWIGLGDGSAADPIATINGAGRPGNGIRLKDEQGNVLCTTSVDAAGSWSCTTTPMSAGPHIITAIPVDESGEGPSSHPIRIYVFNLPQTQVVSEPANGTTANNTGINFTASIWLPFVQNR